MANVTAHSSSQVLREPHPDDCSCKLCLRLLYLLNRFKEIHKFQLPKEKNVQQTCRFLFSKDFQSALEEISDIPEYVGLKEEHDDLFCECLLCSVIDCAKNCVTQTGEQCIAGTEEDQEEETDGTVMQELFKLDQAETAIIYDKVNPMIVKTSKEGELISVTDVSSHVEIPIPIKKGSQANENVESVELLNVDISEVLDTCVCGSGAVSKICVKHIPAYTRHMAHVLESEGCTCTRNWQCGLCQRLNCPECRHIDTELYDCPDMPVSRKTEILDNLNKWLDNKFTEAGIPATLEKCLPVVDGSLSSAEDSEKAISHAEISSKDVANVLEEGVMKKWDWSANPACPTQTELPERMVREILNVDELFDVRPWPRCYKLEVARDNTNENYTIKEEVNELLLEQWKQATQTVEETIPLGCTKIPDSIDMMDKEDEIRSNLLERIKRCPSKMRTYRCTGLYKDWYPIMESLPENAQGKSFMWTKEEKMAKCEEMIQNVVSDCEGKMFDSPFNKSHEKIQNILQKYCECPDNEVSGRRDFEEVEPFEFDEFMAEIRQGNADIIESMKSNGRMGFREEFWSGLEKWRPDPGDNEVRRRMLKELKEFQSKFEPLKDLQSSIDSGGGKKRDFRAADDFINSIIDSLPTEYQERLKHIKSKMPSHLNTPEGQAQLEKVVMSLCGSWFKDDNREDAGLQRPLGSELLAGDIDDERDFGDESEGSSSGDSDAPSEDGGDGANYPGAVEKYDDENDTIDPEEYVSLKLLPSQIREKWQTELKMLTDDIRKEDLDESAAREIEEELKRGKVVISKRYVQECSYTTELKDILNKENPNGLHRIQEFWMKRPYFPYWTPDVIYDFSEIEKLAFGSTSDAESESDYDETEMDELARELLSEDSSAGDGQNPEEKNDVVDSSNAVADIDLENLLKLDENQWSDSANKSSPSMDIGSEYAGGALTLEQIRKGVAGRVRSVSPYAIELDSSTCPIRPDAVVSEMAHSWPFKLDNFQCQAILALEANLNVFVLAHTSAGKTVVAEYAIGMAMRNGSNVIYTSPIKALSNQKYKDFKVTFRDKISIGIITGDVQINEEAQCLIMTTEILRSMLYNNSSRLHNLEFVVFDEVHYFNDPERGNVWEEVLILLPKSCQIVMLSATVNNHMEFASWVGKRKGKNVVVTRTHFRPVPLKHYLHIGVTRKTVACSFPLDVGKGFDKTKFMIAENLVADNRYNLNLRHCWKLFVNHHLVERNCLPAVVFCFSRKKCDQLASSLKGINLTTRMKGLTILNKVNKLIRNFSEEDKQIHQIVWLKGLLMRGIGVHHSGILPLLKEIVEILFHAGFVKLLFATETFAMGVNMPASTVVFESVVKFDGKGWRNLKPAEYTQMAGRAGRRGKDSVGKVLILQWAGKRSPKYVKMESLSAMMTGNPASLDSQFKVRYSMILSTLNPGGDLSIDTIMDSSFKAVPFQMTSFLQDKKLKDLQASAEHLNEKLLNLDESVKDSLNTYFDDISMYYSAFLSIREQMTLRNLNLKTGMVVIVFTAKYPMRIGVVIDDQDSLNCTVAIVGSYREIAPVGEKIDDHNAILWNLAVSLNSRLSSLFPLINEDEVCYSSISPQDVYRIVSNVKDVRMNNFNVKELLKKTSSPNDFWLKKSRNNEAMESELLSSVKRALPADLKYVDESATFGGIMSDIYRQDELLRKYPMTENLELDQLVSFFVHWSVTSEINKLKTAIKNQQSSTQCEYKKKLQLLKLRNFVTKEEILQMKGKIASRMSTHEVLVTEILLSNLLGNLDHHETAALLSCLVYQSKGDGDKQQDNQNAAKETIPEDFAKYMSTSDRDKVKESERRHNYLSSTITYRSGNNYGNLAKNQKVQLITSAEEMLGSGEIGDVKPDTASADREDKNSEDQLPINLLQAQNELQQLIDSISQQEEELLIEDTDLNRLSFGLMPIILAWSKGKKSFTEVVKMMQRVEKNVQEGILVRLIQHLIDTLKDIESACLLMETADIKEKISKAQTSLKRSIIYTESLYIKMSDE